MSKLIQQFERYALLRVFLYGIICILAILYPQQVTQGIIYAVAGYVAFLGIINLFHAHQEKNQTGFTGIELIIGALRMSAAISILA